MKAVRYISVFLMAISVFCMAFAIYILYVKNVEPAGAVKNGKELCVLMYHSILNDKNRAGEYIITPEMFENDLKYLKENGYTTIVTQDLINYVEKNMSLPEKAVIITFDDGYYNNYSYAYPLLKKYNMKGVLSIIGYYTEQYSMQKVLNNNYSHVTWQMLKQMSDEGVFEVQNHSYNLHDLKKRKGILKQKKETSEEYQKMLKDDLVKNQRLLKINSGITATAFTCPFGAVNDEALSIIKSLGFKATYGCEEGLNYITKDPECLYELKRYNRTKSFDISKIL
ncbi:MAG: polysaccharide deacetylase family protein [Clostridia bacterium]|nr:polysaccharide deacetylase family protein [Clostridia bacterium]